MSTTTHEPPATAVAKDAHWSAKMQRLRNRKPLTAIVTYLDDETAEVVVEKQRDINRARREARARISAELDCEPKEVDPEAIEADAGVQAALQVLEEAKADHGAANVVLELQGLPRDVYDALVAEHPPTKEQEELGQTYNVDRFAPALVATCCTDPMTPAEAVELIGGQFALLDDDGEPTGEWSEIVSGSLTRGEAVYLFETAVAVNENARVSLGKGSGSTRT